MKVLLTALVLGVAAMGCASEREQTLAPVPQGLEPRPVLTSVPASAVRVAVVTGGTDVRYDLVERQRYFLVDETADKLLTSGIADEDGEIIIGERGATFDGDDIWEGGAPATNQIALYVNRELEAL